MIVERFLEWVSELLHAFFGEEDDDGKRRR